jgi:hypothetical protein
MALITTEQRNELTTLFIAMFKAAPGASNLSEMVVAVEAGHTLAEVAASLAMKPSFSQVYPGFLTGQEFADRVVANLLTNATPSGAKAFATSWILGKLNAGESRSDILAQAVQALRATTNVNYADAQAQLTNKVEVANYYSITKEQSSDDLAELQEIISGVTSSTSTVTEAQSTIDSETSVGELYSLTDARDNYDLSSSTKVDTVEAVLDGADSTLTTLDKVVGNGDTVLQFIVVDGTGDSPIVQMSGIGAIDIVAAGETGSYTLDGGDLGSDVSSISISGEDDLNFEINDLVSDGNDLHISQSGGFNTLSADGSLGGVNYDFSIYNTGSNTNSMDFSWVGDVSLAIDLGESAYLSLTLSVTDSATGSDASIGDVLMSDIAINVADDAEAYVEVTVSADAATSGDASVGHVTFGDVTLTAAEGAEQVTFEVDISASADIGNATIGNLMVGDVSLVNEGSDDITASFTMSASVSDDGNASVGSVTIGNINLSASDDGYNDFYLWDYAYVGDNGNASVGDVNVGDITISVAPTNGGSGSVDVSIEAFVEDKGNATIGNINIGDVSINLEDSATYAWFSLEATAEAGTGSASIGNVSVGDISMTLGDDAGSASWSIELSASVDTKSGTATIGDVTIGDLSFDLGETSDGWFGIYIDVENDGKGNSVLGNVLVGDITANVADLGGFYGTVDISVSADTGDAIIGDVTLGDISVHVGESADDDAEISVSVYAYATDGDAKIGNVTVGDIDFTLGFNSQGTFDFEVSAEGDDTSMIGDVTIGAVTVHATTAASAQFYYSVDIESSGDIGNVTLGGVTADMQDLVNSSLTYSVSISADENVGDVTVGDVSLTALSVDYWFYEYANDAGSILLGDVTLTGDDVDYSVSITASGDLSDVTIGNVAIDADALDLNNGIYVYASGDIGNVSIGDISISNDGDDTLSVSIYATRDMGDVSIGNINTGVNAASIDIHAERSLGNVTLGNQTIGGTVADGDSYAFDVAITGTAGEEIGNVLFGDISVTSNGAKNVDADVWYTANIGTNATTDDSVGTVTIGDITLTAKSANTAANLDATADVAEAGVDIEADYTGAVLVGDISLTLTNSINAANTNATKALDVAAAYVTISADEATLTVGDISVSAINNTASTVSIEDSANDKMFDVAVSLDASGQALVVGDITVSGGSEDTADTVLDNLANLTGWLTLSGSSITVGDVDFSGYDAAATIDVSAWKGAAEITASAGGSEITVNKYKNTITLGAGADTVVWEENESRTAGATKVAELDVVIGFKHGTDDIDLTFATGATKAGGDTWGNYDQFLAAAQAADEDAFIGIVGDDTYIAVDGDNGNAVDFVIKLAGVTNVTTADITI